MFLCRPTAGETRSCVRGFSSFLRHRLSHFSVKIRRAGVGTHFCMHKHFYEQSEFWQTVRDEEAAEKAKAAQQAEKMDVDPQPDTKAAQFDPIDPIDSRHSFESSPRSLTPRQVAYSFKQPDARIANLLVRLVGVPHFAPILLDLKLPRDLRILQRLIAGSFPSVSGSW
jgi:hypothetical protein